jgi:hypothetical protein
VSAAFSSPTVIVDMVGLAQVTPLPGHLCHPLADIFCGTLVDDTWVQEPGRLIAGRGEDDADLADTADEEASRCRRSPAHALWDRVTAATP